MKRVVMNDDDGDKLKIEKELIPFLSQVSDPEIPVISLIDLGVIRDAHLDGKTAKITITPTYSGCPAMDVMGDDIRAVLREAGYQPEVKQVLAPAWNTDWITEKGRQALRNYGIVPPEDPTADKKALMGEKHILKCLNCGSTHTKMVSQFGSTACKAHFKCLDCGEPFDYFKCLI